MKCMADVVCTSAPIHDGKLPDQECDSVQTQAMFAVVSHMAVVDTTCGWHNNAEAAGGGSGYGPARCGLVRMVRLPASATRYVDAAFLRVYKTLQPRNKFVAD